MGFPHVAEGENVVGHSRQPYGARRSAPNPRNSGGIPEGARSVGRQEASFRRLCPSSPVLAVASSISLTAAFASLAPSSAVGTGRGALRNRLTPRARSWPTLVASRTNREFWTSSLVHCSVLSLPTTTTG